MEKIEIVYNRVNDNFIIKCSGLENITLRPRNGAKCLYHLINNEGRSFNPTILRNIVNSDVEITPNIKRKLDIADVEDQLLYQALNQFIPASDMKTVNDCWKRLKKITQELTETQSFNDLKRSDDLFTEKEEITQYLYEVMNQNGTFRNLNKTKRNSIKSIDRAIEVTLQEIAGLSKEIYYIIKKNLIVSSNQIKYSPDGDMDFIH